MEETLKLILGKLNDMNAELLSLKQNMAAKEDVNKLEKRLTKIDMNMENQLMPKISALFEARDVSLHSDEVLLEGINEVKDDISNLTKAVIRNTADIVDLKDYRKEN